MAVKRDAQGKFQEGGSPDTQFQERNKAALRHGGAAAYRAITEGESFRGLAAQEERRVVDDLSNGGQRAMLEEIAVRLHTCTRLYYAALQTAVDRGDLEALDRYAKRFGWLAGKAAKAWREFADLPDPRAEALDYEQIVKQEGSCDNDNS